MYYGILRPNLWEELSTAANAGQDLLDPVFFAENIEEKIEETLK